MTARDRENVGFVFFAAVAGALSFFCTRGTDGSLLLALIGFGLLTAVYWISTIRSPLPANTRAIHLLVLEGAVVAPFFFGPGLDEMAGMLYLFIPALVLFMVLGAWLTAALLNF